MFADGLCQRWMMMDKTVLEDPACIFQCEKKVEVLSSSEEQDPHQVTIEVGTYGYLPRVYLKEGQMSRDRIYTGSDYSSFFHDALDFGGANVFVRRTGETNNWLFLDQCKNEIVLKNLRIVAQWS